MDHLTSKIIRIIRERYGLIYTVETDLSDTLALYYLNKNQISVQLGYQHFAVVTHELIHHIDLMVLNKGKPYSMMRDEWIAYVATKTMCLRYGIEEPKFVSDNRIWYENNYVAQVSDIYQVGRICKYLGLIIKNFPEQAKE